MARGKISQRRDDRRVGQVVAAEFDGFAVEDEETRRARALLELADEPGLADARLARDQAHPRPSPRGAIEHVLDQREGVLAPDTLAAGDARSQRTGLFLQSRRRVSVVPHLRATTRRRDGVRVAL